MYRGNVQALCPTQTWFCSSSLNFNLQSLFFPTLLFPKIILIHCYFYYVGELRCPSTAGCRTTNVSLHHPSSFNSLNSFSSSCTAMRVWMYSRRHPPPPFLTLFLHISISLFVPTSEDAAYVGAWRYFPGFKVRLMISYPRFRLRYDFLSAFFVSIF